MGHQRIDSLTVEQIRLLQEHCSHCAECSIHTLVSVPLQYCQKHHTDSAIFLIERCEELKELILKL